ncbi:MAG: hypothetical protein ACREJ2_12380 [Planctomycetota bacterium]
MHNAVAIAGEGGAHRVFGLGVTPAARTPGQAGVAGQTLGFEGFDVGSGAARGSGPFAENIGNALTLPQGILT